MTWHFSVNRLVEKSVPSLSQLLLVDLRPCRRFFPRWVVIEDLLRLLLGYNHCFNFGKDILIDIGGGSTFTLQYRTVDVFGS